MRGINGWAWMGALSFAMIAGCEQKQQNVTVFNPFGLKAPFGLDQPPVRIGIAAQPRGILDPAGWDVLGVGSPWNPLRDALQKKLKAPVQIEPMKPFQIAANLKSGRLSFGFMSADDYADSAAQMGGFGHVIAFSEQATRQGLIVANARSDIRSIPEISGRRFSFGPPGDPVLDLATKEALQAAGLPLEAIAKELLALNRETLITVNAHQHHINADESAYEIAYLIGTDAGVIEASDYQRWPETGGNMLLRTFSKDQFRVLGKTKTVKVETIEDGPFIASDSADPHLVDQVAAFLLAADRNNPKPLRTLGLDRFKSPPDKYTTESVTHRTATTELETANPRATE